MANKSVEQHQKELLQAGYSIPTAHFTRHPADGQETTESQSGDGGKSVAEVDQASSPHGYQGKLLTEEEAFELMRGQTGTAPAATPATAASEDEAEASTTTRAVSKPAAKKGGR